MEPIKLHKQGNSSVIIIPDNIIKTIGWEDGTLLDVINTDGILQIRARKQEQSVESFCPKIYISKVVDYSASSDLIRYDRGLSSLINELPVSARRIFFLCLASDSIENQNANKPIVIRADKYASSVCVDKSISYRQMKDAADYFSENRTLIRKCDYINNEGMIVIEIMPNVINHLAAVDGRKFQFTVLPLQSALGLNGKYAWPLYQLIRNNYPNENFTIDVDDLKTELGYVFEQKFSFFKRDVINLAINEIVEKTEIKSILCANIEKQGRKVSKVRFEIETR